MNHSEFKIGLEFVMSGQEYRVTDIGTRTIIAIRLTNCLVQRGKNTNLLTKQEAEADGWFHGPPYAVLERVFDEDDLEVCTTPKS